MAVLIADNYSQVECNRKRRRLENEENNKNEPSVVGSINPLCQTNRLNMVVPDFNCPAVLNGAIKRLQLSELFQSNKAVVLFFYPCDFTPIAAKDIELIQNNMKRFESLSTYPLAVSPDTENVHLAYANQSLNSLPLFPLVADTTRSLSRHFNVMNQKTGLAYRAAFIIDKTRQVRFSFILEDDRISHSIDTICAVLQTF